MSQKPDEQEKELIRKIQRGEATVDFETGVVRSLEPEPDYNSYLLGKLRRKLIPNRRIYERKSREEEAMRTKTTGIEQMLEQGIELTMTPEDFIPEVANRYNLHMGKVYRIIISGMNPTDTMTFDGIMTKLNVFVDNKGFAINELTLEDGLKYSTYSEKIPFSKEFFRRGNYHLIDFGIVLDEEGFQKARDRRSAK